MLQSTKNTRAILPDSYRFVRSDVPDSLTEPEIQWLIKHNIVTVIDLRQDDKPTIGIAKNYHKIEDVEYTMPPNEKNAYTDIVIKGEIYGRVLRTLKNVKPVFVSIGNYIDLDTATKMVCDFINSESHIPLPTRLADIETHKMRRILKVEKA